MMQAENLSLDRHFGVVDYAVYQAYLDSDKKDHCLFSQFAENVIHVLTKTGTTLIDNAPIMDMKKTILDVSKEFFALPEDVKQKFVFPDYNERGYLGYGRKKIKDYKNMFHADSAVFKAMKGIDFEHIKDVRNEEALKKMIGIKDHVPAFNEAVIAFSERSYQMGHAFTEVLAHYFDLPQDYAVNMKTGNNLLRLLHYMPFDKKALQNVAGATRASAHADISAFTFLLTSDQPGLQIAPKEAVNKLFGTNFISNQQMGEIPVEDWVEVPTEKNQCIMNIGRTIEILTNGILPATPHQVVPVAGQEGQERFSIPFFYHLPWNTKMDVWQKAIDLREGENYFEQKGLWKLSIEEYVLHDDMRCWIEPVTPVAVYRP
jgi:isopenicillin N synthase-like dioxygenase